MESKVSRSANWTSALPSIVIPVCIGMSLYLGLSAMIERGVIADETLLRYLTGHPISHVTVAMFFIGLGSLMMIGWNVAAQFRSINSIGLTADEQDSISREEEFEPLAASTNELLNYPPAVQRHYLWRRLHDALEFVRRTDSTTGFEDELKYLSELDGERQQQRYSLVRILIWATPMLGFLGTVLGISQALGGIQVGPENDFSQMMGSLRSSLYVAFDTTALALALSMVLMFAQFFVDRFETQLLVAVDLRSRRELAEHVSMNAADQDSTEQIKQVMLETTGALVERQAELWRKSIEAAEKAWIESLSGVSQQVRDNLTESLDHSVHCLADYLGQAIRRADVSMSHRWHQWQVSLSDNVRTLREYYVELSRQTQLISDLLKSAGGDAKLSEALLRSEEALGATESLTQTLDQMIDDIDDQATNEPAHQLALVTQDEIERESLIVDPVSNRGTETADADAVLPDGERSAARLDVTGHAMVDQDVLDVDRVVQQTKSGKSDDDEVTRETALEAETPDSIPPGGPAVKSRVNWDYFRQSIVLAGDAPRASTNTSPQILKFAAVQQEEKAQSKKKAA